jgi:hypothetical protein
MATGAVLDHSSTRRRVRAVAAFVGALVLGLVPLLPLELDGAWYLFSAENASDATAVGRVRAVVSIGAGVAPLLAAPLVLSVLQARGRAWVPSLEAAAVVVCLLDGLAMFVALFGFGGI